MEELVRQVVKMQKEIDNLKRQERGADSETLKAEIFAAQEERLTEFQAQIEGLTTVVNQYISIFETIVDGGTFVLPDSVLLDSTG